MFLKSAVSGSLEKPRVGEIGILLKDFFGSSLIVKYTTNGLAHWLIIKKHISFFLQLEQPFGTELLVYSFVETKITRIKEEGVFLVSRSRWIEWDQSKAFSIPGKIIGFTSGSNVSRMS